MCCTQAAPVHSPPSRTNRTSRRGRKNGMPNPGKARAAKRKARPGRSLSQPFSAHSFQSEDGPQTPRQIVGSKPKYSAQTYYEFGKIVWQMLSPILSETECPGANSGLRHFAERASLPPADGET